MDPYEEEAQAKAEALWRKKGEDLAVKSLAVASKIQQELWQNFQIGYVAKQIAEDGALYRTWNGILLMESANLLSFAVGGVLSVAIPCPKCFKPKHEGACQ